MSKKFNIRLLLTVLFSFPILLSAQIKVGFVNSERIRTEYVEFKEAADQLQLELMDLLKEIGIFIDLIASNLLELESIENV